MIYLMKGLLIGLLFGIPVGAVGTLTLQRTINNNSISGFITGLGSSVADILYACIGVFGITLISEFLFKYQSIISLIGAIFILILGISTFRKKEIIKKEEKKSYLKLFISSFIIGITNPATILSFIYAFTFMGIEDIKGIFEGLSLVIGVLIGTLIWWSILVFIGNLLKKKMNVNKITLVNKLFGCILIGFSIAIVIKTIM